MFFLKIIGATHNYLKNIKKFERLLRGGKGYIL
jgi:hypothetical protein